jgi:hypothetical protein
MTRRFPGRPMMVALAFVVSCSLSLRILATEPDPASASALQPVAFRPLPLGSVRPAGWLEGQLRLQASGLGGHLDEFWPDIKDSAWFGGKAEGWERVPYWLDGFVPLAYLLDDAPLKDRVKKDIDYILDHQHPDGWFGPVGDLQKHRPYDVWPLFPLLKALTQYQEATGDPRVVPALLKCARKIAEVIGKEPMYSWARFRAADLAVSLYWLHEHTDGKEPWLLDLAQKVRAQAHDWRAQYEAGKFPEKTVKAFGLDSHGVNNGMALKAPGVWWRLTGDPNDRTAIDRMLAFLDEHHGQPSGMFSCDEHLAGRSPSQGTELCTVDEAMFSLETLLSITGEPALGDRLERIAFNAFPATFKKDMTAHQYDQQANQVVCKVARDIVYVNNGGDANIYGLEPNFGCCTANMHQGWPKYAASLWMRSPDGGLAALSYAPCTVETKVGGKAVRVVVVPGDERGYPFNRGTKGTRVVINIHAQERVRFPLHVRIPGWAEGADVGFGEDVAHYRRVADVKPGTFVTIDREWGGKEPSEVSLNLPMPVRFREGFNRSVWVESGPLVYALAIEPEWKKIRDRPGPFDDWEAHPKTAWNYALELDREHPERSIELVRRQARTAAFTSEAPSLVLRVKGRRLPGWTLEKNAAAPPPPSPVSSDAALEELTLIPYGCTDLRVTEFPWLRAGSDDR